MSNLLPLESQKKAWRAERSRMVFVASLVMTGGIATAALSLAPGILAYRAERLALPAADARVSDGGNGSDNAAIAAAQAIVAQLAPLAAGAASSSEAVRAVFSKHPAGVIVDHLTYAAGHPAVVSLSGKAATPEALNSYQAALASDGHFSAVSVPISALVGSADGRFTMTLSGNF